MPHGRVCVLALVGLWSSCAHRDAVAGYHAERDDQSYWPHTFANMLASTGAPERVRYAYFRGGGSIVACSPSWFIAVLDDGTIHYEGFADVREAGRQQWTVSPRRLEQLADREAAFDVLHAPLREVHSAFQLMDADPSCLRVRRGAEVRSTCFARRRGPAEDFVEYLAFATNAIQRLGERDEPPDCRPSWTHRLQCWVWRLKGVLDADEACED